MRKIRVRLDSQESVNKLSERFGYDLTNAKRVEHLKDEPNLFGFEYMTTIERYDKQPKNGKWLDLSKYEWEGMPEYKSRKIVSFALFELNTNLSSLELSKLFEQPITDKTKSIWYPQLERKPLNEYAWRSRYDLNPNYPIYIISKGRWKTCKTAKTLDWMNIDYRIVVEPEEANEYSRIWGDRVLVGDFDTTTRSSIPVRNWVDEHCQSEKYWLMDDNINYFYILNNNQSLRCKTGAMFLAMEDFANRFKNIALVGMNKLGFCKPTDRVSPYVLNTRVYSCTLLDKSLNESIKDNGILWRGRYNEDTDLNIRFLNKGYCTVNFQMFLADKTTTMRTKGGNTDTVYTDDDKRLKFAQSLVNQHPDIVKVVEKWGRYHHSVDWSVFTQQLEKNADTSPFRDYGLYLDNF